MAEHPFIWPNHGPMDLDSFGKCDGFVLVLQAAPSAEDRRWIQRRCPKPIAGFFDWDGATLTGESEGDVYDVLVNELYGGDEDDWRVEGPAADAFAKAVQDWVEAVHARCPVRAFEGPGYPEEASEWATWSVEQLQRSPVDGIDVERWT